MEGCIIIIFFYNWKFFQKFFLFKFFSPKNVTEWNNSWILIFAILYIWWKPILCPKKYDPKKYCFMKKKFWILLFKNSLTKSFLEWQSKIFKEKSFEFFIHFVLMLKIQCQKFEIGKKATSFNTLCCKVFLNFLQNLL